MKICSTIFRIKRLLLLFTLIFSSCSTFSQESGLDFENLLLSDLDYEKLRELEEKALDNNESERLKKYTEIHVKKAGKENNNLEIARAFYYRTFIEEPQEGLKYADSIIFLTKNSEHPSYPTLGYTLKAHIYYYSGNFRSALDNYLEAYNLAYEKKNTEQQREISLAIAAIRNISGQHHTAAEHYRSSLDLLKKENNFEDTHFDEYMRLLYNLSLTHLRLMELDSSKFYAQVGIQKASTKKAEKDFQDFVLLDAQINYYDQKYGQAKDTLFKYLDGLSGTSRAIKLYYLGKIEKKTGNPGRAIAYFKEIDSIVTETSDPFKEVTDVYQELMVHSILEGDKLEQIKSIEKLIYYDSIISKEKEGISNRAVVAYDIPHLKHQKKLVEQQLQMKKNYITLAGVMAGMASFSGLFFYMRSRKMKKKLELLLNNGPGFQQNKFRKASKHPDSVPPEIRDDILKKLEDFEKSDRYLNKDLDMWSLAQEIGTNTSYLSVVINNYKQMNFPNYLKDLRITKAINRLNEDPGLLKFNYQGLADTFGFKTGESFSRAFYKKTGVSPSKFLNGLKSRNRPDDL